LIERDVSVEIPEEIKEFAEEGLDLLDEMREAFIRRQASDHSVASGKLRKILEQIRDYEEFDITVTIADDRDERDG